MKKSIFTGLLSIVACVTAAGTAAAAEPYKVQKNDTLWKIEQAHSLPINSLQEVNPAINPLNLQVGTKVKMPDMYRAKKAPDANAVKTVDGKELNYKRALSSKATAYSAAAEENGGYAGLDYYGNKLKVGTIAVDPDVIPLGSKVYITGYDFAGLPKGGMVAHATDIGGAIKNNRIDIFVPGSPKHVSKFGVQNVKIYVLK